MKKLLYLLITVTIISCSNEVDERRDNPFIGIWINNQIQGQNLTIEFTSDFKFYYSAGSQEGTYTLNGNVATIDLNTTNNSTATIIDETHINWVTIWTKQ
jgi:hypothetical protein